MFPGKGRNRRRTCNLTPDQSSLIGGTLTENIPPVPTAPQPQSYPPYQAASEAAPGNKAPNASTQPYPPTQSYAPAPPDYGQAPYQQPQAPQYASYPPQQYASTGYPGQPKASGFRITAGIIGIVLGIWILKPAIAGMGSGETFPAFLILLAALGNITAGILLLVKQRARSKWAPVTLLSTAGASLVLSLMGLAVDYYGPVLLVTVLPLTIPIGVLLGLGLAKEKRGA